MRCCPKSNAPESQSEARNRKERPVKDTQQNQTRKLEPGTTISIAVEAILSASIPLTCDVVHDSPTERRLDVAACRALVAAAEMLGLVEDGAGRGRILFRADVARLRAALQLALDAVDDLPRGAIATLQAVPGGAT